MPKGVTCHSEEPQNLATGRFPWRQDSLLRSERDPVRPATICEQRKHSQRSETVSNKLTLAISWVYLRDDGIGRVKASIGGEALGGVRRSAVGGLCARLASAFTRPGRALKRGKCALSCPKME